jgi:hypothetical protein
MVLASRQVTTLAGTSYNQAHGIALDANGTYALVADTSSHVIRRVELTSMCRAGSFCPSGSSSATQSACNVAGYYCPAGSSSATQAVCNVAGFYCPANSSSATQTACNVAGYFCPAGSSSAAQGACSAGYYCPSGSFNARGGVDGHGTREVMNDGRGH